MAKKPISKKPLFNLNLVVQETGIKADTLRAWERRYQLPTPSRTEGGHRLFSSYDIETIKWLLARQEEGMRISQAVDYWRELIAAEIDPLEEYAQQPSLPAAPASAENSLQPLSALRQQWIEYSLAFDEKGADKALDTAFRRYPWETVSNDLIYQGLAEIGERWYQGEITVQQEHFASELVVKKLQSLIAAAPEAYHPQKVLISNPPGEFHTIAPLVLNLLLRYRGWEVAYLGANVPLDHLEDALNNIQPALVVMTAARLATAAQLLKTARLLAEFEIPLAFSGGAFQDSDRLAGRIPGVYLGQDLGEAVFRIENLLSQPDQAPAVSPQPSPHRDLAENFRSKLSYLENAALIKLEQEGLGEISSDLIRDAHAFLLQDLLAALQLGDIELLESNLDWVGGLLRSRDFEVDSFQDYLASFIAAARDTFGGEADLILDWLSAFRERLSNEGGR